MKKEEQEEQGKEFEDWDWKEIRRLLELGNLKPEFI